MFKMPAVTPVYQWKKNGINVGTNSWFYTDNALIQGTITCTVSTNIPVRSPLQSNAISISPVTPVLPSVVISSDAGNVACSGASVLFTATGTNAGSSGYINGKE